MDIKPDAINLLNVDLEKLNFQGWEVAKLFWRLDSDQQASFFNMLASFDRLPMQLQAIIDSEKIKLTEGKAAMRLIGEYGIC